ncbi:MAG TPA: SDR family oxidoreductase, partial [Candidatus Limnocylindria bacterium]|nr:SDR family oxidoreductase [Candidatus Limnocylindria bacterium]
MDLGLKGKVVLIAGASQGMGKAAAAGFAREGAKVAICARGQTALNETAEQIRKQTGGEVLAIVADMSKPEDIKKFVDDAAKHFGRVDVVVNNAGGPPPGTKLPRFGFLGLTDDDWREMFEFNLLSAVRACRAALPLLVERDAGAIVNVSSVHGRQPSAVNVDYGAAKAAMI